MEPATKSEAFRPAWWLPGPHLQTTWAILARDAPEVSYRRELLPTPDGDELVLDHVDGPSGSPRAILLHGLEGSSSSVHILGMARALARRSWRVTAVNFRSCARDPKEPARLVMNRTARLYHSGETTDLDLVVRTLRQREPEAALVGFGISLGGNVLLKWLGEDPESHEMAAAASISAPYDLAAGAAYLELAAGRFYTAHYLRTLKLKMRSVAQRFPEAATRVDLARAERATTFSAFDDATVAPLHGFDGAADYYRRSSSIAVLSRVRVPALLLSAEDDPFLPSTVLGRAREVASPAVELVVSPRGGHVGFVSGPSPWRPSYWAEERIVDWFSRQLGTRGKSLEGPP